MDEHTEPLLEIAFAGQIIEWRGPAPFLFIPIPEEYIGEMRFAARQASYGWGVIPAKAAIDGHDFGTSLFPRDGGYLLPVKVAVQRQCAIGLGDHVQVVIRILPKY